MPDDRRTPILSADGQTYCSPGCGRQCRKEWFDHATKRANELAAALGDGWEPHVWENLGWHWSAIKGDAQIHPNEDRREGFGPDGYPVTSYTCYLNCRSTVGEMDQHGGTAAQFIARADDPNDALGFSVQKARTHLARVTESLDGLLNG